MKVSITSPLSTATPDNAMKPTAAETENGMPRSQSATMPPDSASGTALKTSSASRAEPSAANRIRKIITKQAGTTMVRRSRAEARFSNCPPQVIQYPDGSFTSFEIFSWASRTTEPMSRPRTFAVTTTRRFPFSRLTWLGPSVNVSVATSRRGIVMRDGAPPSPGSGTGRADITSALARSASGSRTTIWKRRSPSNTSPASRPPIAVPITS